MGALHAAASRTVPMEVTIAEDARVAVRYTATVKTRVPVTWPGGLQVPAGRPFLMRGVSIIRLPDGRLTEEDAWTDWPSALEQPGRG